MWIVAWTINDGTDEMVDRWLVAEDESKANAELETILSQTEGLHCWAIAPISKGSEPQYTEA